MKFVEGVDSPLGLPTIELTRRNLEVLLAKLDDPLSFRMIAKDGYAVKAVENDDHYANEGRPPGEMFMPTIGEFV